MMFPEFELQIRQEAIEAFPHEAVWLITSAGCRQVDNIHDDPGSFFSISERDTCRAMAEGLLAVVHSHPSNIAAPSASDMQSQINTGVPWGIVGTDGINASDIAWWGRGVPTPPLIGRGFRHGITDCYSLIRDYFLVEKGAELPEFPRNWRWWEGESNFFEDDYRSAGFRQIDKDEAQPGDVWLAQIRSDVANHGGILLEHGLTLHQIGGTVPVDASRLSTREPIFRYSRHITHWLRYVGDAT